MNRRLIITTSLLWITVLFFIVVSPAQAGVGPTDKGAEMLMADWLLLSYLVFFGIALTAFLVAVKRGLFTNVEEAKYYMLTIHEPDYYTPEWAKEETDGTDDTDRSDQ